MIKKSLKYIKKYIQYIILFISLIIGLIIRSQGISKLKSSITGQFMPQALDPYYFLRLAESIVKTGLPTMDLMRSFPLGQPLTHMGNLMSYFLVFWHKITNIFTSITLQHSTIIFPVMLTVLTSLILFFLTKRLLNWKVASLSVFIFNIIPALIHRTSLGFSDHDILGLLFMLLTIYLFVVGLQSKKYRWTTFFGVLSSLAMTIGILIGGNTKLALIIISIPFLLKAILNKISKKEYYLYVSWLIPITLISIISGERKIALASLVLNSSGIIAYFVLITLTAWFIFQNKRYKKWLDKIKYPDQVKYFSIGIIFSFILGFFIAGIKGLFLKIGGIFKHLFNAFAESRHATTVAENQTLSFNQLIGTFGWLFFIFFLIGTWIILYKTTKELGQKRNFSILYGLYLFIFLISKAFSLDTLLIIGTIACIIGLIWLFIKNKNKEYNLKIEYLILAAWVISLTYIVSFAARLIFEFTPIFVIISSFFIICLIEKIIKERKIKNIWLKIGIIILICLIIISPFGLINSGTITSYYKESKAQASYIGPGMDLQWQYASEWAKNNTAENAVFAHWWDYGYWVQYGFQRATLTDGSNTFNYWNYLIGREVLTGKTLEEPLKFLKTHNTTHLLMVADEIGKYGAYSLIGSDENMDRYSYIGTFGLNNQLTQETQNTTYLAYTGTFPLDQDLIYQNKVYSKNKAGFTTVIIPITKDTNGLFLLENLQQPKIILSDGQKNTELKLKCLYLQNQKIEFKDYDYEGCFRVLPIWTDNQNMNNVGAGLFLSTKVYDTVFARIYLMNEESQNYRIVYTDEGGAPLSIYNNRIVGPIKIWEINYPENLTLTKEEENFYLATSFKEAGLESRQ